jgi:cytochrome c peroxidase
MGVRNSPGLFNLAWNTSFMWDGGINHIEIMSLAPLTDPNEMNMDMGELLQKLSSIPEYPNLFNKAFGSAEITDQRLFYALTQFMVMLVSSESKYDKYIKGEISLSSDEQAGLELFNQHCATCHSSPLLTDYSFRNNGLSLHPDDIGRERITLNSADRGKFKVPSLRNIALTFPYMHDGRFSTLEEVIDHYRIGIVESETIDPLLANGISLSSSEKEKLITFLHTLSDQSFRSNQLFKNPFDE